MYKHISKIFIPVVSVAVVAGSVAAYFYFKGTFSDASASSPLASAKLVPDDALLATFISTNPKSWSQLQQFGTPEAQKLITTELQDFNQQMLAESRVDYEKDLKPWVGSVMVALLPSSSGKSVQDVSQSAPKANFLVVVGIKDKLSASNFANKLKADKNLKNQEIDYKGQKITEVASNNGEPTYSAVLNDHLVFAPKQQSVEQAIDTFEGEPSFASKAGADSILAQGLDLQNAVAQIYLPDYAGFVKQLIAASPNATQLPPATLAQLQQVKSVVAGVGIDQAGIRMKALAVVDPAAIKLDNRPSPGKLVSRFPTDTIALVTGQGISRNWSAFMEQMKTTPEFQQGLDQTRQGLKIFNLDLDKDIFGWMDGEFALAAIPSQQGILAPLGFGGVLMINTSDRTSAESTFNKLDQIAKNYFLTVAPRNVGGKTVTEWQVPSQGALLGHGWLDQNTAFVALGAPIADAIATQHSQTLNDSETFKAATGSLLKPNGGYFYLDMDKTMSLIASKSQASAIPPETSAILSSIRGIGMTTSNPDKSTSQMELLLALKPKRS